MENSGTLSAPQGREGLLSGCDVLIRPEGAPQVRIETETIDYELMKENPYALAIRHRGVMKAKEAYISAAEGLSEVQGNSGGAHCACARR